MSAAISAMHDYPASVSWAAPLGRSVEVTILHLNHTTLYLSDDSFAVS